MSEKDPPREAPENPRGDDQDAGASTRETGQSLPLRGTQNPGSPASLEERWGGRQQKSGGNRWLVLLILALLALVIGVAVGVSLLKGDKEKRSVRHSGTGLNLDQEDTGGVVRASTGAMAWFEENPVEAFDAAVGILERCGNGSDVPVELMRDAERIGQLVEEYGAGWDSRFAVHDPRLLRFEIGSAGETGFMVVMGRHENHVGFRSYFVKMDDGLRMDWEASTAHCGVEVEDLAEEAPEAPVTVRGWIGKQPHFDSKGARGDLFSWYQVLDAHKEHFVWAYAPAGSRLDEELKMVLNYGRFVMPRLAEVRATVRLVKPKTGFRENEFEVVELVAEEWVMP